MTCGRRGPTRSLEQNRTGTGSPWGSEFQPPIGRVVSLNSKQQLFRASCSVVHDDDDDDESTTTHRGTRRRRRATPADDGVHFHACGLGARCARRFACGCVCRNSVYIDAPEGCQPAHTQWDGYTRGTYNCTRAYTHKHTQKDSNTHTHSAARQSTMRFITLGSCCCWKFGETCNKQLGGLVC